MLLLLVTLCFQNPFTYDGDKRVQSRTQWGYTVTYSYDALDRVTQVSYPDGTTEQTVYNIMEVQWRKDRLGHWTRFDVDADQHIIGILDPASDYTAFEWCKCGSLDAIVDANGNTTRFGRDVEGRVTSKTYADGHGETYSYNQYSGWPQLVTDAKGQTVTTQYALDGRPVATLYSGGTIATSNASLTWDARYPRVTTMIDGTGTTGYTYEATGTDGAGQIASVDGPLGSDTITYTYDDLGRVTSHAVNGTGESVTFDALGRVATVSNPLDAYTLTYDGSTSLLTTISGPSSFTITNAYDGTGGDYRLLSTGYAWSGTQSEGAFAYQYDAGGRITQWNVQAGSGTARQYNLGYDPVSRLTSGLTINPSTSMQIAADAFLYDRMGNRLGEQLGQMVSSGSFNTLNQLLGISAGGNAVFRGSLNEPGTVVSGSTSARTDGSNNFSLSLPVTVGTNAFTLVATDINGNATTNTATVVIPTAGNRTYTYDLNGNLTSDGEKTYEWDEADQLVAINYTGTTTRTQFTYDGLGRRVEIKELNSGTTVSDTKYVWDGMDIAEARASDGTTVQKRFFGGGFQSTSSGTANYYYIRDHLGSIREVFDGTGAERGQWSYDLFGNRSLNAITSSPVDSDFGYTGHFEHIPSALMLAPFRAYDPSVGRWLARDPLGESGGLDLYSYVLNDPIDAVDPMGLLLAGDAHDAWAAYGANGLEQGGIRGVGKAAVAVVMMTSIDLFGGRAFENNVYNSAYNAAIGCPGQAIGSGVAAGYQAALTLAGPFGRLLGPAAGTLEDISYLRRAAVRDAWAQERQLVQQTGQGTRNWTEAEMEQLLEEGKVSGYEGHHINSVSEYPKMASDPNNIRFLTRGEHFEVHDFNWSNPTSGPLIFRQ